jgi:hypothetical protein
MRDARGAADYLRFADIAVVFAFAYAADADTLAAGLLLSASADDTPLRLEIDSRLRQYFDCRRFSRRFG